LKKINIGIVGSNFSANLHMLSYPKLNQSKFQILGVASGKENNARVFSKKYALHARVVTFQAGGPVRPRDNQRGQNLGSL
jgi:predicted dehydrogenase